MQHAYGIASRISTKSISIGKWGVMDQSVVMDGLNVSMDKSIYEVMNMDQSLCCGPCV